MSPLFAAEIVGLDLRRKLPEAVWQAVYDAFVRYQCCAFRDQTLTQDEQIAFTEQFGTLERHIARNRGSDNPRVHTVSNLGAGRASVGQGQFDESGTPTNRSGRSRLLATILHAVTMPPNGGDTFFAKCTPPTRR